MAEIKDPENTILMETTKGNVTIVLFPDLAPGHVGRIKELAREGAYDGVVFHRVIDGFMAQTGDVKFGKSGGSSFNPGRAGMGGSDKPDAGFLNRQYTVWGQVIEGMENVDKIKRGEPVQDPDKIVSMKVAADAK